MHRYKPDEVLPLAVRISQGQFGTVSDLKVAVKQWYGVTYQSDTSYRELFKDGDFSIYRTTAQYRSRASQEKIADFEDQLEKSNRLATREGRSGHTRNGSNEPLFSSDAHPGVGTERADTGVRTRSQRDHIDFYGALEVRGGWEIALPAPEQTSEVMADFIRILLVLFPTQTLLLLLDRTSWNKGPAAQEVIEENDRLHIMYFPVACPDLNPQEHVWAVAREAVSRNHGYRDFDHLINDFEAYLNENLFESNFMDKYGPSPNSIILL